MFLFRLSNTCKILFIFVFNFGLFSVTTTQGLLGEPSDSEVDECMPYFEMSKQKLEELCYDVSGLTLISCAVQFVQGTNYIFDIEDSNNNVCQITVYEDLEGVIEFVENSSSCLQENKCSDGSKLDDAKKKLLKF